MFFRNKSSLESIKNELASFKKNAGNPKYVACFGKTYVDQDDANYKISQRIGELVIDSGFAVLHGGYIGTMEAVSSGANVAIGRDQQKNRYWNIGVPMKMFDGKVKRAKNICVTAAKDIFDRKRILVEGCDLCIVLPVGGMGTLLEVIEVFHANQINEKFGGVIRPIILYGDFWKGLWQVILKGLDLSGQSSGANFISFVSSEDELKDVLRRYRIKSPQDF